MKGVGIQKTLSSTEDARLCERPFTFCRNSNLGSRSRYVGDVVCPHFACRRCNHHRKSTNHGGQWHEKKKGNLLISQGKTTQIATINALRGWVRSGGETGRQCKSLVSATDESTMSSSGTRESIILPLMREPYAVARAQTVTGRNRC